MIKKITFILLAMSAIIAAVYLQGNIKTKPQVYFIGFSALTTILLFTKIKIIPEVFYLIMLGLLLYFMFFLIGMSFLDFLAPERATAILADGRKIRFNDPSFIYVAITTLIISILIQISYAKNRTILKLITFEKYVALLTFLVAFIGYII
jgi:hypothetical protein